MKLFKCCILNYKNMSTHKYNTRSKSTTRSKSNTKKTNYTGDNITTVHKYNTRFQSKQQKFDVDIDFDDASKQWRKNKRYLGNGCYIYKKTN